MIEILRILIILFLLTIGIVKCDYEDQPKILIENGTLVVESAVDRNVSFKYGGRSTIMVGDINLVNVLHDAKQMQEIAVYTDPAALSVLVDDLKSSVIGPSGIDSRLRDVENMTRSNRFRRGRLTRLIRRIDSLERRILTLQTKLSENNCNDAPCKNGGTCFDLYDDFFCECQDGWQGTTCEEDFDECSFFAGTELGCQNNARCVNTVGSYNCECTPGWVGLHCTKRKTDCQSSPSAEMCGHGVCLPVRNETGYVCLCEQGWQRDNVTNACTVDVNECDGPNPCLSRCINLPGSYQCGPCDPGYTGNGWTCTDIDECAINNGGCSLSPHVRCYNTEGSYRCGSCPPGYVGDGKTCTPVSTNTCNRNNVCHPLATCQLSPFACICPRGMIGDGIGPNGCRENANPCEENLCLNGGTCVANGTAYSCICPPGLLQPMCMRPYDPCHPDPCNNGATCVSDATSDRRYSCQCPPGFFGKRCAYDSSMCTGMISEQNGLIHYPGNNGTYQHNDRCVWVLKTFWGKVLNVTFASFNLEYSDKCVHDWLQIHDGRGSSAPLIGRFCGTDKPGGGNIISSHNYLYMWFRSDNSSSRDGFEFYWNSIDPICGGQFDAEKPGVIASPGYPGKTPQGRRCDWNIQANPGKRIQLIFYSFEAHGKEYNCTHEYLAIHDGEKTTGALLGLFCDDIVPEPIQTASHQVLLSLQTDMTKPDTAFQLHYAAVPGIPGCGGTFTSYSGQITSPSVDGLYPSNVICEYVIELPAGSFIDLRFKKFKLEETTSCNDDYLEIYEGKTEEDDLVGRWCGENSPGNYTSLSNTLLIKFRSDFLINAEGFTILYKSGCTSLFVNNTGFVKSPNYPGTYFPDFQCVYKIEAPAGYVINITSQDFNLESSYPSCQYDFVELFDGNRHSENSLGRYCSSKAPPQIVTSSGYMEIHFQTDATNQYRGFYFQYSFVNVGCGGVMKDLNGTLSSPNANEVSETGLNGTCVWIIDVPSKYSTYLKFSTFNIACGTNYLELSQNGPHGKQTQRFCGAELPPTSLYSGRIKITYKSQFGFSSDGFEATYEAIDTENQCGGNFTSPAGSLQTPGYPRKYPSMKTCVWIIVAPLGHQIELSVKRFYLETDCQFDYLEIRDGRSEESPVIGKYCGDRIPPLISSLTNALHITFQSDVSMEYLGFDIDWQQTATGCGGNLQSYHGSFVPPHFPDFLNDVMQCDWQITINQGSSLIITVKYFDNEADSLECAKRNYISVYDGDSAKHKKFKRNCTAGVSEDTFTTTTNTAFARFLSTTTSTGMFHLNYTINCNNVLRAPYGVIESPNYPNNYPNDMTCEWKIVAKRGTKISVSIFHFDLEDNYDYSCPIDRLEITEIKNNVNVRSAKYCNTKPPDFTSEVDEVIIKFVTDSSVYRKGFRLEYRIEGCDRTLTEPRGMISSPGHPQPASNKDCEYFIEVGYGNVVAITLNDAVFPMRTSDCSANGLVIADGYNTSNILAEICQPAIPGQKYVSTSNKMYLHFRADSTNTGKRFSAIYGATPAACGGHIRSTEGYLYTPNYPEKYEQNTSCLWQVEVQRYHTIDFSFIGAELSNSSTCADFVEIFNGNGINDTSSLYKYCGGSQVRTDVIRSDESRAVVLFKSTSLIQGKGVKIYYKQNCGYSGPVGDDGVISKRSNLDNCIWTLKTDPGKHLRVSFSALQCSCSIKTNRSRCENDEGIFVYDGDSINAPLRTSFCKRVPLQIISSGSSITIKATKGSFDLVYSTYTDACGGVLTALHGSLASPNYPNPYPKEVECIWTILAPSGNSIQLHFEDFEVISPLKSCDHDYVEVRESEHGPILGAVYCGNELPSNIVAFESMWIKFRSTDDTVGKGFYAEYFHAHDNRISGESGVIKSPPWDYMHTEDIDYTWRVHVNSSNSIMLNIRLFSDGLKIYNGYDETAPEMEIDANTDSIMSATNIVFLKADHNIPDAFEIGWRSVPKNTTDATMLKQCGNKIVSVDSFMNFTSPGYPDNYADNLNCEWIVKSTDPARHIVIYFPNIDMEATTRCSADFILLSQSTDMQNWVNEVRVCTKDDIDSYRGSPFMRIRFVTDVSITDKGFLAQIGTSCGSNLTTSSGIIDYDESAHPARNCSWRIRVSNGRKIKFQFLRKRNDIQPGDGCTNYVSIRDGFDSTSPLLGSGKYCTNHTEDIPPTTSSRAFVSFVVSDYHRKMKWTLLYNEVRDYCGESVQLNRFVTQAIIITPNFPNIPKPYSECTWTVVAPVGESINITFIDFHMRPSYGCEDEYLQMFDGATTLAPELGKFCWASRPDNIRTSQNTAHLKYLSEIPIPSNGFKLIVSIAKCGSKFSWKWGIITSKNYPAKGAYPRRSVCEYEIEANRGYVNVTFDDIDLPMAQNASQSDHLIFYNSAKQPNNSTTLEEVLRVYGNNTLRSRIFLANDLLIKFFSFDNNAAHRGFKISYEITHVPCDEEIRGESGEISTPSYPSRPPLEITCSWRILVPQGRRVKLEFIDYRGAELMTQTNGSDKAVFIFYNDYSLVSEILSITESAPSSPIYSSSRFMAVKFEFEKQSSFISAKMRFSSDELTVCKGDVTAVSGQILPPPGNIATYYCDYLFDVSPNETLAFTLRNVVVNGNRTTSTCPRYAPIKIIDRISPDLVVCSNITKMIYTSASSKVNLKLVASSSFSEPSYVIEYKRHACGGVAADVGELNRIEKPFFSENYGQVDCLWNYPRRSGAEMINLTVTINSPVSCESEYVKIRAGSGRRTEKTFCGNVLANNTLRIPSGRIHYHADSYAPNSNFNIDAKMARTCGSVNHNSLNDIGLSKSAYINNADCLWYVITDDYKSLLVKLEFVGRFFIETSPNCTKDYLEIRNEDNNGTDLLAKICGRESPAPIYTRGRVIKLTFKSDNDTVGDGFTIRVTRICTSTYNATTQWQNISKPLIYSGAPINCTFEIFAPTNRWIYIQFNQLEFEAGSNCERENITATIEIAGGESRVPAFCTLETRKEIESLGKAMIVYQSGLFRSRSRFSFAFRMIDCGGIITESTVISSPQIRDKYLDNMHCLWNITTSSDRNIRITFEKFHLEYSSDCSLDYVRVFSGSETSKSKRKANLCGNLSHRLPRVLINSSQAVIEAGTDSSVTEDGFVAVIKLTPKCDTEIYLNASSTPYNFDRFSGSYANDLDCHYVFSTDLDHQLELTFNQFDVTPCNATTPECLCDFVELTDTANVWGGLNGRFCGNQLPPSFSTFTNKLFVRFVSDSRGTGAGFRATVKTRQSVCGQSSYTVRQNAPVTLEFPPNNRVYPSNVRCFWQLTGENPFDIVFETFDLPPPSEDGSCTDYLEMTLNAKTEQDLDMQGHFRRNLMDWGSAKGTFKYCGNSTPHDFFPDILRATVKFLSSSYSSAPRFKFIAKTLQGCNKNITQLYGQIVIKGEEHCTININVPENYTISLHVINTIGRRNWPCTDNATKIYDQNTNTLLNSFCGMRDETSHLFYNTSRIRIDSVFNSGRHFEITYIANSPEQGIGCGGDVYGSLGVISSPLYPSTDRNYTLCRWNIRSSEKAKVKLEFIEFDLGSKALCDSDYLQIVEYTGPRQNITRKFCGEDKVGRLELQSNTFSIIYKKTVNFDGTGWVMGFTNRQIS